MPNGITPSEAEEELEGLSRVRPVDCEVIGEELLNAFSVVSDVDPRDFNRRIRQNFSDAANNLTEQAVENGCITSSEEREILDGVEDVVFAMRNNPSEVEEIAGDQSQNAIRPIFGISPGFRAVCKTARGESTSDIERSINRILSQDVGKGERPTGVSTNEDTVCVLLEEVIQDMR